MLNYCFTPICKCARQNLHSRKRIRVGYLLCPDTRVQVEVRIGKLANAWL